ncbi:TPA: hypothetical protein PIU06_003912 [Klebsiella quasipneumoniae subsp. similipneumoniae]|uniref:DUF6602 domain-containing protein n=1 Tax=Klebsiella quasipneumoniae TaxID=1463165 RepID=UPI002789E335|nr:DUF6602 domain-containing protein [Klebsiella quasipneumoniae]MDX7656946.1 DUF6602 domain-containing protein [Klebsiella quasipneumoniae]HDH1443980.1 hypothetical protein [Klebsiella quasipneumoniae subsp. similipneumoniae]HDT0537847.1 hypothetical protein [Klebsiella quasipneumoniae subsp. similipneumoniae]
MSIISEKISSRIKTLKQEYTVNKNVEHQGVKGGLNEVELIKIIKDVIPRKYEISRGIIENSHGDQSNESDIIIYDNEILPPYINNDLAFVPIEAVRYNIEIKSTLTVKELKTTIEKFRKFRSIGGKSPTVLFAFSSNAKKSELSRYYDNDTNFLANPAIGVLCISDKCYYYKHTEIKYLKDYFSNFDMLKAFMKDDNIMISDFTDAIQDILKNDELLSSLTRSQFALLLQSSILAKEITSDLDTKKLTINGLNFDKITFKIHQWIGVECNDNDVELSFFSGISNTLSKETFGDYLLNERKAEPKVFSICCEDMWGNLSCQKFDKNGLSDEFKNLNFSFQSSAEESKITFFFKQNPPLEE